MIAMFHIQLLLSVLEFILRDSFRLSIATRENERLQEFKFTSDVIKKKRIRKELSK